MRIDAHVMFQKPAYLPCALWPRLEANRFDGCIAVQRRADPEEARWLLQLASEHPFVRGVVVCTNTLDEFETDPSFRGVYSDGSGSIDFYRELGRRGIPLEINSGADSLYRILDAAPDLRAAVPAQAGLKAHESVYVKLTDLSGPAEQHGELVCEMFEMFGASRILFGSNWPDCLAAGTWKQTLATFTQALGPRTMDVRSLMLGDNAVSFYKL